MPLSDYSPLLKSLATGLAGSAAGTGLTYMGTRQDEGESQDDFEARRRSNMLGGAVAGGALGAAAPTAGKILSNVVGDSSGVFSKIMKHFNPLSNSIPGAAAGAVTGTAGGALVGKGLSSRVIAKDNPWDAVVNQTNDLKQQAQDTYRNATTGFKSNLDALKVKMDTLHSIYQQRVAQTESNIGSIKDRLAKFKDLGEHATGPERLPTQNYADHLEALQKEQANLEAIHSGPEAKAWERAANAYRRGGAKPPGAPDLSGFDNKVKAVNNLRQADQATPLLKKLFPSYIDDEMSNLGIHWTARGGRLGARYGGIAGTALGAVAPMIWNHTSGQ